MRAVKTILLATLLMYSGAVFPQDIHFSQFYNVPMVINSASTGIFDGDWQATAGYRNQWRSIAQPYRTLAVSFERQFYVHSHHLSGGVYILNDNSGHVALKSTQFVFSGAYHRNINNHLLHGGLQVGFMHRVVDFSDITFPAQWDPSLGQYNPLLSSGAEDGDRLSYLDVGMGFIWQKKYGKLTPEAGFSLYHLNNPKESFYGADTRLPMKIGFSAAVKYDISQSFILQPRVLVLNQAKAKDYIAGSDFGYILAPNASGVRQVNAGVYLRNTLAGNTDAFIIMGGVVFRNFQIGISYDLNISPLKSFTNSRGAFELTLIYRSISTVLNTFTIPCERF